MTEDLTVYDHISETLTLIEESADPEKVRESLTRLSPGLQVLTEDIKDPETLTLEDLEKEISIIRDLTDRLRDLTVNNGA